MDTEGFRSTGRGALVLGAMLAASSALTGCSNSDQTRKQLGALEKQIPAMRADQDRLQERLSVLEIDAHHERGVPAHQPVPSAERLERPRLKVIHLASDDPEGAESPHVESAPTDIASQRPVIRGTGDRVIKMFDAEMQSGSHGGSRPLADRRSIVKD